MSRFRCATTSSSRLATSARNMTTVQPHQVSRSNNPRTNVGTNTPKDVTPDLDLSKGVKSWEGRVVFEDSPFSERQNRLPPKSPLKTPSKPSPGTISSPISISSQSSPSTPPQSQLTRPRGIPHYAAPLPRTAYTPPRAIHPFFNRTKSLPPPPPVSQRPRLVAEYWSTSESQSTTTAGSQSQSTQESVRREDDEGVEALTRGLGGLGMGTASRRLGIGTASRSEGKDVREMYDEPEDIEAGPSQAGPSQLPVTGISKAKSKPLKSRSTPLTRPNSAKAVTKPQFRTLSTAISTSNPTTPPLPPSFRTKRPPRPKTPLPLFSYKTFRLNPPKIAYTTSPSEANDLLSCLRGPILGFDMEWPIAGWKTRIDPKTHVAWKEMVGGKKGPDGKIVWGQCKTALIQICDENLVVLLHVWNMKELPSKLIEILEDPTMYKAGVAIKGDAQKLRRDYPNAFPNGINSLLELSSMARKADPVNTGPGRVMISLANLTREYLGRDLEKDPSVRTGDWMDILDRTQIDYATNDVVVAIHLYEALLKVAAEQAITLRKADYVSGVGHLGQAQRSASPLREASPPMDIPPSQRAAVDRFLEGLTCEQIAEEKGVKADTIRGYLSQAMNILPVNTLNMEQQARLIADVDQNYFIRQSKQYTGLKQMRDSIKRMRKKMDQTSSESEGEESS